MTSPVSITLRVNDTAHAVTVPPDMPLLWVPRAPRTDQKRQQTIWRELAPTP